MWEIFKKYDHIKSEKDLFNKLMTVRKFKVSYNKLILVPVYNEFLRDVEDKKQ